MSALWTPTSLRMPAANGCYPQVSPLFWCPSPYRPNMLVMDTSALLTRISDTHGAARQVDLQLERSERRRLQALVDSGRLRRYPHGVVALPDVDKRVLIARVHRGLITCEHAAVYYRLPLPSSPKTLHVLTPRGHKAARYGVSISMRLGIFRPCP